MQVTNSLRLFLIFYMSFVMNLGASEIFHEQNKQEENVSCITQDEYIENLAPLSVVIDDQHFKLFVVAVVENALQEGVVHKLSPGLLQCYENIIYDKNVFLTEDLISAFPDLEHALEKAQSEALRINIGQPWAENMHCDLSAVANFLHEKVHSLVVSCCNANTVGFNSTFTTLFDIKNTLTACCNSIVNDFNGTFSVLSVGFNSTYSILYNGFSINVGLNNYLNELINLEILIGSCFNLAGSQLAICCATMTDLLVTISQELSFLEGPLANLNGLAGNSNCVLKTIFPIGPC